jgi:hypothetical protein
MVSSVSIVEIGVLVDEPTRVAMLQALMDGRALTVSALAQATGATPQTASSQRDSPRPCYDQSYGRAIPMVSSVVRIGLRGEQVPVTALGPERRQPHRKEEKDDYYDTRTKSPEVQRHVIDYLKIMLVGTLPPRVEH